MNFYWELKKVKYVKGQVVFREGEACQSVFVVFKGNFEMQKKLP